MTSQLKFTINLAKKVGNDSLGEINKVKEIKAKDGVRSICTNVDIRTENLIISAIRKKFPGHNIVGEESGNLKNNSDYTWIIDPIDGTRFFESGIKYFTISIALWYKNKPLLGVVYNPGNKETYYAEKNKGAYCGNKRLRVSSRSRLNESIICFSVGGLSRVEGKKQDILIKRLQEVTKNMYRFYAIASGTLPACYVAQGLFDAYFDLTGNENIWDPAAGIIIVQEAGGRVTGLDGKWPGINASHLLVTNGKIHTKVLKLLNKK